MEKTAIMEAIEEIKKNKFEILASKKSSETAKLVSIINLDYTIDLLTSLLPKEREQIEKAVDFNTERDLGEFFDGSEYFIKTYGETK